MTPLHVVRRYLSLAPRDLLRDATYRRLWTSILISSFGSQVTLLALPLTAAVLLQASPTQMGVLTAMETVPFALFALPTGVWLDRIRKLPVYVFGQLAMACMVATVPLAWWLKAHARNALASSAAEVTGPGAAGALIQIVGAPFALLVDAALLTVSASILRGVPVRETPSATRALFWPSLREGLAFVHGHRLLLTMAGCVGVWQFCNSASNGIQILFATRYLGLGARAVGLSYVALGIGTVAASAVGPRLSRRLGPGRTLVLGFAICGSGWLLLAVAPASRYGVVAYAAMLLCYGIGAVLLFVNFLALRQSVTPGPLLGRMTSTMRWLILVPAVPGAVFGGWLGEHLGLRSTLGFSGTTALALAIVGWRLPSLRRARLAVATLPA